MTEVRSRWELSLGFLKLVSITHPSPGPGTSSPWHGAQLSVQRTGWIPAIPHPIGLLGTDVGESQSGPAPTV